MSGIHQIPPAINYYLPLFFFILFLSYLKFTGSEYQKDIGFPLSIPGMKSGKVLISL